jgi:glycosyltransferase involved in cell wall biosynthesis
LHHAGGTAPPIRSVPYVLTVHDLQPLERRATHGAVKRAYLRAALPRSVARARRVVVPSEHVRRSVIARLGTDPAKVVAVPHGVTTIAGAQEDDLRARYDLPGAVILYPAITYPHKNHAILVDAFARIAGRHPDAVLVLTGGAGGEEVRLRDQIDALGLAARVRRPGRVVAADVAGLYRMATVVAVPSRYEGFGLPAAEAMAYGAPLVASAATALPEVVGDAGRLVDPDDPQAWATALEGLLVDEGERARLVAAGRERAARYTWAANAEALAAVYRDAI